MESSGASVCLEVDRGWCLAWHLCSTTAGASCLHWESRDLSAWLPAAVEQVYKARLRVNGQLVAIKVQRPMCESTISLDLYILRFYAGFLTSLLGMLKRDVDLRQIIDDFGELIYREIDYRAEMVNCQQFAELYASIPDVFVPKVRAVCAHVVEVERLAWPSQVDWEPCTRGCFPFFSLSMLLLRDRTLLPSPCTAEDRA